MKADTDYFSEREQLLLAYELIETNIFELGQIAYEYIGKNKKLFMIIMETINSLSDPFNQAIIIF